MRKTSLKKMAVEAKCASRHMSQASTQQKNAALQALVIGLEANQDIILKANQLDIDLAKAAGLSDSLIDRLSLQGRLCGIVSDIANVIRLDDPVGECFDQQTLPNNLSVAKCRTPIGVLGVIYESRPNVTIDVSALSIKSGNCVLLRGGSETIHTNMALVKVIQEALVSAHLPAEAVQLVANPDRRQVKKMLRLYEHIDLIIPRGGAALHKFCRENSTIPVITGGIGICHLFVDETADLEKAVHVIVNAKTQRPTVCNALDTLLAHEKIAAKFLPFIVQKLQPYKVELRVDPLALKCLDQSMADYIKLAKEPDDWSTEWLSLVLGIKVVKDLDQAIKHIFAYGSGHSDGILTNDSVNAEQFVRQVDSAAVYVNASTRFTDGGQLGLGAEVAISTQKLHARGPMGLKELTTYKWIVRGNYHVR